MTASLKKLLKPVASLYLTVALLAISMILIYAGTTVQKQLSILDVQKQYFHSWFTKIPLDPLLRPFAATGTPGIGGSFWFVGGYTLILLLLLNLFAAHSVRFKLNWKRSGIIAIHLGLIVLLFGEVGASMFSVESQMMIDEGQTVGYTFDTRHTELAVIDPSNPDHDNVTVFDASLLKPGAVLKDASLPFELRIDDYFNNSALLGPMQQDEHALQKATTGKNQKLRVLDQPKSAGTESAQDIASSFVTVRAGDKDLGTFFLSQWANYQVNRPGMSPYVMGGRNMVATGPDSLDVNGKPYQIELRYRRYYKPYQVTLLKFSHDVYPGTNIPRNFSSRVRLTDPSRNVDREVLIWMNHPLTYPSLKGETFYQQNFLPGDRTTVLQVTHNPAWPLPYIGLAMGFVGMLFHFGMNLKNFLGRYEPAPAVRTAGRDPAQGGYTLEPASNLLGWTLLTTTAVFALVVFAGTCISPMAEEEGFDLASFGQLPIMYGGRVMPLDSVARTSLRIISNRETFKDTQGKSHPAIRWLADSMSESPASEDYKVIRIDYPDILTQLGLDQSQKYFSINDLKDHFAELDKQARMADAVGEKQRDAYQTHLLDLYHHVAQSVEFRRFDELAIVPPATETGKWGTLVADGHLAPGAEHFAEILQDYREGRTRDFNRAVAQQHAAVAKQAPAATSKSDFEWFFNKSEPFFIASFLYVGVFLLACFSWLFWRRPLWAATMGLLFGTLLIHSYGILARVYITDRGPITNLYASAIFIAWAAVIFSIGLEVVFKNGLGAAIAALVGFGSLLVAHFLGNDGDTMKPVVAVLATNFWLWTHVPCVALGYAATFFSGALAVGYVVLGLFTRILDEDRRKSLARMVYAITCFAILFSFVGTILGGIWADYSWGRFWGWDPKENGAILIVLWNAIILHARWAGLVKERGMMLLAIFGNVVTAWSWFGTNLLGIGLHSYGFMEGAASGLISFSLLQLLLIAIGLTPKSKWRGLTRTTPPTKPRPVAAMTA